MACTAPAYAGMGGMNTRMAAEDFYFLQHLKKTSGIACGRNAVQPPLGLRTGSRSAPAEASPASWQEKKGLSFFISQNVSRS